jgi:hypothetical protein
MRQQVRVGKTSSSLALAAIDPLPVHANSSTFTSYCILVFQITG